MVKSRKLTNLEVEKKFRELSTVLALLKMVQLEYFGKVEVEVKKKIGESKELLEGMIEETQDSIKRIIEKEEEVLQYQEEFISNINHELRTPLTSILGTTDFLLDSMESLEVSEMMDRLLRIRRSGKVLLEIVDEILDFSKLEAGVLKREKEEFIVGELIEDVLESYRYLCQSKGIFIREELELVTVKMSWIDLRRVFNNLMSNAYKFTEVGEISIGILELEKEGKFQLWVKDTGLGIREEDIPYIFERFWKGGLEGRQIKGSGIGLYMVYKIVKSCGGNLYVDSELGVGSQFLIELPLNYL